MFKQINYKEITIIVGVLVALALLIMALWVDQQALGVIPSVQLPKIPTPIPSKAVEEVVAEMLLFKY